LLTVVKGLGLAYAKDLQEDKEPVFAASDALGLSLSAMAGMVGEMAVNAKAMRRAAEAGYPTATDLADWMVKTLNLPFREAHKKAAKAVQRAENLGVALGSLPLADLKKIEPKLSKDVYKVLSLEASVRARQSEGGTAPNRVAEQIGYWKAKLKEQRT